MAKSYQHTRKKKEYAAIEIEKLKAEIQTLPQVHIKTNIMSLDKELVVPLNKVIEKLDNRISELKGEKDNNDFIFCSECEERFNCSETIQKDGCNLGVKGE